MKKNVLLISLLIILVAMLTARPASAQTSVTIAYAGDDSTTGSHCPPPFVDNMYVYGNTTGYSLSDSIDMYFNFGDGSDTTIRVPVNSNFWIYGGVTHSYSTSGQYSVEYIVTGPDGAADTLVNHNQVIVGDSCGNVSGTVYIDGNSNCTYDIGETPLPWMSVQLLLGPDVVAWAGTDSLGHYYFNVPIGLPYTIQIGNFYNSFATVCPASGNYSIATAPSSGNDFALECSPGYDLTGWIGGWGFRPNAQPGVVYIHVNNQRCTPTSGQAVLILDPLVTYVDANPAPTSISGDTLTWDFSNLTNYYFFNWWSTFSAYVQVLTSPSAVIGDTVCFQLTEESVAGDAVPSNNVQQICYAVHNSWDPNEKSVDPVGLGANGRIAPSITKPMDYTIHFQNTGTDVAYNVFIMDTIDSNLDMNTFQVIASSHPMDMDILPGNIVRFSFNNIMLPDSGANQVASNGFVSYSINQKANLTNGTILSNTGAIYFDFNAPVITNTTINTIDDALAVGSLTPLQSSVRVYPNPASSQLTIVNGQLKINRIEIYNVFGQKCMTPSVTKGTSTSVNIAGLSAGIYFVKVSGDETQVVKFVKE